MPRLRASRPRRARPERGEGEPVRRSRGTDRRTSRRRPPADRAARNDRRGRADSLRSRLRPRRPRRAGGVSVRQRPARARRYTRRVIGLRSPHPLALLVGGIILAAAASWVLPARSEERRDDPATGRRVVVAGTYHRVEPSPVGPLRALVAIPKGMTDAGSVIFFVFLIGGAFTGGDRTRPPRRALDGLVRRLERREALVPPPARLPFALGGVLATM